MKPRLKLEVIAGRPVSIKEAETPIEIAKRRHGKPFGYQQKGFVWTSDPTVLTKWLEERKRNG